MDATITDCSHEVEISLGKISITTSSLYIREMIATLETTPITTHQNFKLRPISKLSVKQGRVFLGWKSTMLGKMYLTQGPQRCDASGARFCDPYVSSQALYHWATALTFKDKTGVQKATQVSVNPCANPGIFVRGGGVQVSLTKKLWQRIFFSPQLILQKSNGQFQRNLSFFKVPEGVQHFPGGGVQLLIPNRNPYNLGFSRGVRTPCPSPSGSAFAIILSLALIQKNIQINNQVVIFTISYPLGWIHFHTLTCTGKLADYREPDLRHERIVFKTRHKTLIKQGEPQ